MPIEHVSVSGEVTWGLKGTLGDERYWCEGIYAPSSRRPYTHVGNAAIDEHKVVTIGPPGGDRFPTVSCRNAALSAMAEGAQETCQLSRV